MPTWKLCEIRRRGRTDGNAERPKREIDEDAVLVVEGIFRGRTGTAASPNQTKWGSICEWTCRKSITQISFNLQIKGMGPKTRKGKVQPIENRAGHICKAIELEHIDYYMKLPVPVFLVVVDVMTKVAYYIHIQRYVLEELRGDDWRERLRTFSGARQSGCSGSMPTKTIRIPIKSILSDTEAFKGVVRDAKGFMASLSVKEGIAYSEQALQRLDERFKVTFIKGKDGECFQLEAREPVEWKLRADLTKEKFDTLFGKGLPIDLQPGEITIQGSPLLEKINSEGKSFQIRQEPRGFLNILRLDGTGQAIARLEYLPCEIEGGHDEWRFNGRFPHDLVKIGFDLDLTALRDDRQNVSVPNSTFTYKTDLAAFLKGAFRISLFPRHCPISISGSRDRSVPNRIWHPRLWAHGEHHVRQRGERSLRRIRISLRDIA